MNPLYKSITQVAEELNVNPSLLRFWEKNFHTIKPRKDAKGTRYYTEADIAAIKQIYFLLREQKLTIAGAKEKLRDKKDTVVKNQELHERLLSIRKELLELKSMLNEVSGEEEE